MLLRELLTFTRVNAPIGITDDSNLPESFRKQRPVCSVTNCRPGQVAAGRAGGPDGDRPAPEDITGGPGERFSGPGKRTGTVR
ncbi:hypothetical protein ACFYUK_16730 [Nonomuraea wenchangensis]